MNHVESINLISINIKRTQITNIDNKKLAQEILLFVKPVGGDFVKSKNYTYYEDIKYPSGEPESEKLIVELTEIVSDVTGKKMVLSEIWTVTLANGQSVAAHSHKSNLHANPEDFFSIAYYLNAPVGSAELIFMVNACNTLERAISIKPETGDLLIFNSYLIHMTNRHQNTKEDRIVVSANFRPEKIDNTPAQDWSVHSRNV